MTAPVGLQAVLQRIDDIQQTLQSLQTGGATAASSASASGFADALAVAGTSTSAAGATAASGAGAASGTSVADAGSTGDAIVADASKYLGVPYVFGGTTTSGMDCSGLVQTVLKDLGMTDPPRLVSGQAKLGTEVPSLEQAQPGDLIALKGYTHIVIYAGDGKIIHAPKPGKVVSEVPMYFDASDIQTIRRIDPASLPGAAVSSASTVGGGSAAAVAALLAAGGGSGAGASSASLLSSLAGLVASGTGTSSSDVLALQRMMLTGSAS